jgi:hypothetical protein
MATHPSGSGLNLLAHPSAGLNLHLDPTPLAQHPRYSKVIVYSPIMTENQPESPGSDESVRTLKPLAPK